MAKGLLKFRIGILFDPVLPLLGSCSREKQEPKETQTREVIATAFR